MKTNKILVAVLIASSALFNVACKKNDVVSPTVTNPSTSPQGKLTVSFSVQVLPSSVAARTQGLSGSTVTIQSNGGSQSATTDASGIANFSNVNEGTIAVFVKGPTGFSSFNTNIGVAYNGSIVVKGTAGNTGTSNNNTGAFVDANSNNTLLVTLPADNATLKGKIKGDFDNSNVTVDAVIPSGAIVIARAPIGYEPNVYTTTTDGTGAFTFTNLPEGIPLAISLDYKTTVTSAENIPFQRTWNINVGSQTLQGVRPTDLGLLTAN